LPDVNGFEVCRRLKAHVRTAHIPVVFVSSLYGLAEGAMIASRLGAVGYLTKPVQPRDLVNVINLAICKRDVRSQHAVHAAQSDASHSSALRTPGADPSQETGSCRVRPDIAASCFSTPWQE